MRLLGIDLETGQKDKDKTTVTEIGAVLWDTDYNAPVEIYSALVKSDEPIIPEFEVYTGITNQMMNEWGEKIEPVLDNLLSLWFTADYIVAHNGNAFDRPILERVIRECHKEFPKLPWIDTMIDVPYPANCTNRNLTYLQAFHGFAYPGHRAVFDVMAMFKIMMGYPLTEIIENAESPKVTVIARFDYPQERQFRDRAAYQAGMKKFNETKDKVKGAGFRWEPDKKQWILETKESLIKNRKFDFPVHISK